MNHRPYPSPARARRQLDRHARTPDAPVLTLSPTAAVLMRGLVAAVRNLPSAGQAMANAQGTFRRMPSAHDLFPTPAPSDAGSGE